MFISSTEKSVINARLEFLEEKVNSLTALFMQMGMKAPAEVKTKSRKWNQASKTAASARMKKYWADKRAKKVAA
jgi:hypothetical protein